MAREGAKRLSIWMNGHLVGCWSVTGGESSFTYQEGWLESPRRRPISLSLPLRASSAPYRGEVVANFFDNLLPDSTAVRTMEAVDLVGPSETKGILFVRNRTKSRRIGTYGRLLVGFARTIMNESHDGRLNQQPPYFKADWGRNLGTP